MSLISLALTLLRDRTTGSRDDSDPWAPPNLGLGGRVIVRVRVGVTVRDRVRIRDRVRVGVRIGLILWTGLG